MFWTISQDQSLFASFKKSWRLFTSQFVLWYYWMMDYGKHKCALLNGSYVLWKSSLWSWSFSIVFLWLFVKFSVWTLRNLEQSNRSLLGYRGRSFCQTLSDEELKPLSWSHQIHQTLLRKTVMWPLRTNSLLVSCCLHHSLSFTLNHTNMLKQRYSSPGWAGGLKAGLTTGACVSLTLSPLSCLLSAPI